MTKIKIDEKKEDRLIVEKLEKGMKRTDIIKKYGQPDEDLGSGTYIYVYHENDKTIVLNFDPSEILTKITVNERMNK